MGCQITGIWIAALGGGQLLKSCPTNVQQDELQVTVDHCHYVRIVIQVSVIALVNDVDVFGGSGSAEIHN